MKFAVIIPTRDRPRLLERCIWQMERQTLRPNRVFIIGYPPDNDEMDLVPRVKAGVELAIECGIDLVFIVEDDDFYEPNHFERFKPFFNDYEFFGDEKTTYYHLKQKAYNTYKHSKRSSLFTTGFKVSALDGFEWPADNERFLDIKLWNWARQNRKMKFVDTGAIGIKGHNEGKTGGKGHTMKFPKLDKDLKFFKSKVNGSFEFYSKYL